MVEESNSGAEGDKVRYEVLINAMYAEGEEGEEDEE